MGNNCYIEFYIDLDDDPVFTIELPYSPVFEKGQEVVLHSGVVGGFESNWKEDDIKFDGKFRVLEVFQTFERRYALEARILHWVTVKVEVLNKTYEN